MNASRIFRAILLLILSISYATTIPAQDVDWLFTSGERGGEVAYDMARDAQGNLYMVGRYSEAYLGLPRPVPGTGLQDIFVHKLSPTGQTLWVNAIEFDGLGAEYIGVDDDQNVYVAGHVENPAVFGIAGIPFSGSGSRDAFVGKFDPAGNPLWVQTFGGPGLEVVTDMTVDGAGNIYIAGGFTGTATFPAGQTFTSIGTLPAEANGFVVKLDRDGNGLWDRPIYSTRPVSEASLEVAPDGSVFVLTMAREDIVVNGITFPARADVRSFFLVKYDANGGLNWCNHPQAGISMRMTGMDLTPDGDIVIGGSYWEYGAIDYVGFGTSVTTSPAMLLVSFAPDGRVNWVRHSAHMSGSTSNGTIDHVTVGESGNIYATGRVYSAHSYMGVPIDHPDELLLMRLGTDGRLHCMDHLSPSGARIVPAKLELDAEENLLLAGTAYDDPVMVVGQVSVPIEGQDAFLLQLDGNAPVQAVDDAIAVAPGFAGIIDVLGNDLDPDATGSGFSGAYALTQPLGTVYDNLGDFLYIAPAGFTGVDSFRYAVCDGGCPVQCDSATARIYIGVPAPKRDLDPVTAWQGGSGELRSIEGKLLRRFALDAAQRAYRPDPADVAAGIYLWLLRDRAGQVVERRKIRLGHK